MLLLVLLQLVRVLGVTLRSRRLLSVVGPGVARRLGLLQQAAADRLQRAVGQEQQAVGGHGVDIPLVLHLLDLVLHLLEVAPAPHQQEVSARLRSQLLRQVQVHGDQLLPGPLLLLES